jgi:hypothetical protein
MNSREQGGSEEVMFEDIDLVYIFPFDLGAPIKADDLRELLERFSERYKMIEGIWIPPEEFWPPPEFVYRKAKELRIDVEKIGIEGLMKNERLKKEIDRANAMFEAIVSAGKSVFDLEYLELGRFVRLKLTDLNVSIKDPELSYLNELKYELYLLLHSAGVAVLTAWIHLNGNFSTDDVIKIEGKLYKAKCMIKDPSGNIVERTLRGFIVENIMKPLHAAVLFKDEYGGYDKAFNALERGNITGDKIMKKLRTPYSSAHTIMCIRRHRCNCKCETAEEAVERHLRELAGISRAHEGWRYYREDAARKRLGENLSSDVYYAMFVAPVSLFLGSAMLDEGLKSEEDKELVYRKMELSLVQPAEFLLLSEKILDVYTSVCRSKFEEIKERRRKGETVKPSEVAEIREGLVEGLEEYNNVSLFIVDPYGSIMEQGKKD